MTVESASYISQLDAALPAAGDQKSEGDDHFRLIKSVLKTQFPNFGTTAITTTAAEVNYLSGVTSAIQTQINSKAALASPALTGVPTAPTAAPGTNTTQLATTAFVAGVAFSTALPSQTGNGGKLVTTDGTNASWTEIKTINGAPLIGSTADLLLEQTATVQRINTNTTAVPNVRYVIYGACTLTAPAISGNGKQFGIDVLPGVTGAIFAPAGTDKTRGASGAQPIEAPFSGTLTDSGATDGWI